MVLLDGSKPVLVYDGECGFCRRWIERWQAVTGDRVVYAPYQTPGLLERLPGVIHPLRGYPEAAVQAVQWVEPDGEVIHGAEAVFRALARAPRWRWLRAFYRLPGTAAVSERLYRWVARHRSLLSRLDRWLFGDSPLPPTFGAARGLYLRALGLVYLCAFLSLWRQVHGLIGREGILPVEELKERSARLGRQRYLEHPTLCWLNTSDAFLDRLCGSGVATSLMLIANLCPRFALMVLWASYLSLATAGQEFLAFQWDALLLEAGLLAVFLAPSGVRPRGERAPPSGIILFLHHWLLFRLIFQAGCVKLLSGDPCWRGLTALECHYETQPLPTWIGWYAHQLPRRAQRASCVTMFAIEFVAPFFLFGPRLFRLLGAALIAGLQVLVLLTGNYGFFNYLTIALTLLSLDDATLARWRPGASRWVSATPTPRQSFWRRLGEAGLFTLVMTVSGLQMAMMFARRWRPPAWAAKLLGWLAPFRSINRYGLFAVMTTTRPEIIVEGSEDGVRWEPYVFRYKPQEPRRAPGFVAPHQPRLDWQIWFAALGDLWMNPWFVRFLLRLLEGSRAVTALLADSAFRNCPPRYVRARLYQYEMAGLAERQQSGIYWKRKELGLYCPPLALSSIRRAREGANT